VSHESLEAPRVLGQLAALNSSARIQLRQECLQRKWKNCTGWRVGSTSCPVRLEYAKALALNARGDEANREMQIIRSAYPPSRFDRIEREWLSWLKSNAPTVTP